MSSRPRLGTISTLGLAPSNSFSTVDPKLVPLELDGDQSLLDSMSPETRRALSGLIQQESASSILPNRSIERPPSPRLSQLSHRPTRIDQSISNFETRPPTSLQFSDISGPLQYDTIEQTLANPGYIPTAKILIRDGDDHIEARYIEATTKLGQKVYIQLDLKGHVAVNRNDLTMIESKNASFVPYSARMGAFECAGLDTCGVAFTCDNNVCILTRDKDATIPEETNFVFIENPRDPPVATLGSSAIPYPIVRLSEIQANPDLVLTIINDATRRIRNASYDSCNVDLTKTAEALHSLNNAFFDFDQTYTQAASNLAFSITELENLNTEYIETGALSVEDPVALAGNKEKYGKIIYDLRKRHEHVTNLLRICSGIGSTRKDLLAITEKVQNASNYIRSEMSNLDEPIGD